jgi:hypothetical protein
MEKILMPKEPLVIDTNSLAHWLDLPKAQTLRSTFFPINTRTYSNILPYCSLLYTFYIARISEFFSNYSVLSVEFWVISCFASRVVDI